MRMNASYMLAGLLLVVIMIWFFIKTLLFTAHAPDPLEVRYSPDQSRTTRPVVVVQNSLARLHQTLYRLYGRTEPNREVIIKASTAGLVIATPAQEGTHVKTGDILCQQEVDARQARLAQSQAMLRAQEFDFKSTQALVKKGFKPELQLTTIQANVDAAQAAVTQAEIELENIHIRAPFDGLFERQIAETGDYLTPAAACGLIVELSPLIISVQLGENQINDVQTGDMAEVRLATGQTQIGKVRYIEARANPSTRTFQTEIVLENQSYQIKGGVSASVILYARAKLAHYIPAKILTLNEAGQLGVRYLDERDIVHFTTVSVLDENQNGLWVSGLPERTRIIVEGQDYVSTGTHVTPHIESF